MKVKLLLLSVVVAAFSCTALPTFGQSGDCTTRTVIVNVRDKEGKFVPSLAAENFRATLHGQDMKVLSVNSGTGVHRVVLALDVSGSMVGLLGGVQRSSEVILGSFPQSTQVAVVVFAERVLQTKEFDTSRAEIPGSIKIPDDAGKRTALWDALLQARALFGAPQTGDSVIVVSDGGDNFSTTKPENLKKEFLAGGVRLSLVKLKSRFVPSERVPSSTTSFHPQVGSSTKLEGLRNLQVSIS